MKRIALNGKEYPCRVTMGAMVRFKRESGHDAGQMKSGDTSDLVLFLWCCVASACSADGVEFPYDFMGFADAITPGMLDDFYKEESVVNEKKTVDQTKQ
ncbi:MAG: hypothetical protein HUJ99_08205 [Bacteroidaceae bacterium]|nr:hypothetical protein [Bacteroidaceae bacterium]